MRHKPLLEMRHVTASYGPIKALQEVSLTVYEKEIVTLIGANGAGKSTLLMSIFGQPRIQHGQILYNQEPIENLPTHEIAKRGITIAPERRRIFAKMSTEDNLLMGAFIKNNKAIVHKNLQKMYALFPQLYQRRNQRAGTLSGGEQQMLSMARALMSEPKLFLLDEPSLGLAPQMVKQIFALLKEIADLGMTILLIEQNAYHALKLANRAYVLVNGTIQLQGQAQELLHHPDIQAAYLGGMKSARR